MPFAAAQSWHPVTAHATGEAVGQVIDQVGTHPDVALLVVTPGHAGALEDVARAVQSLLRPTVLVSWAATGVTRRPDAAVRRPHADSRAMPVSSIGLWAAVTGPVAPVRFTAATVEAVAQCLRAPFEPAGLLLVGPPTGTGPAAWALTGLVPPDLPLAGGVCALPRVPVLLDGKALGGLGGVLLGGVDIEVTVEEGRRPIGGPMVATATDGVLLRGLGGRPAMAALVDIARDQVPAADIRLINRSLHLLVAPVDGSTPVLHAVRGSAPGGEALVTDPPVPIGAMVQCCVRDPGHARSTARARLAGPDVHAGLVWRAGADGPDDNRMGAAVDADPEPGTGPTMSDLPVLACDSASVLGPNGGAGPMASDALCVVCVRQR